MNQIDRVTKEDKKVKKFTYRVQSANLQAQMQENTAHGIGMHRIDRLHSQVFLSAGRDLVLQERLLRFMS